MKILQYRECPDCGRMVPYIQSTCDCGFQFTGKEPLYKTCPYCGSLNPSTRMVCDCGHFVLFSHSKLTSGDVENAYTAGHIDGMAEERNRNDAEWTQFFKDACLKDTITGEPIQSLEDFHRWKAAFDKARAEKKYGKKPEQSQKVKHDNDKTISDQSDIPSFSQLRNTFTGEPILNREDYQLWQQQIDSEAKKTREKSKEVKQPKHMYFSTDGETAEDMILECSFKIVDEVSEAVSPPPSKVAKDYFIYYTIPSLLCALTEKIFFQTDSLTKDIIEFFSSWDSCNNPQKQWEMEATMWKIHDSLKIELDIFRRKENPLSVFISLLQELLFVSFSKDLTIKILEIIKDFGNSYTEYFTYERITQYNRPTPSIRKMQEYFDDKRSKKDEQ